MDDMVKNYPPALPPIDWTNGEIIEQINSWTDDTWTTVIPTPNPCIPDLYRAGGYPMHFP